jgi:tyrosine-protein phosphatase SIW14
VTARGLWRWAFGITIAAMLTVMPFLYYRANYAHAKRFREVSPGVLYRSGQLTTTGFAEVIEKYGIRTVVNLQDEYEDPGIREGYLMPGECKESELCARLGVRYEWMPPALIPPRLVPEQRPKTIDAFLKLMDDPANHPVLIHCRAGLHRTGCLVAVYRMEYDGRTRGEALRELIDNGFGRFAATSANDYITQYILSYEPRRPDHAAAPPGGVENSENPGR